MLSTAAIKADQPAAASSKDKDAASATALEAGFSAYFCQMVAAALPSLQASAPAPAASAPSSAPAQNATAPATPAAPSTPQNPRQSSASAPATDGSTQAAAGTQAQASSSGGNGQSAQPDSATNPAPAAQGQAAPTVPDSAAKAAAGPVILPQARSATPQDTPAQTAAPAAPASTPAAAASDTQAALAQAYPGGKFQVQYDDQGTPATTKAPLTEFVNQIQMTSSTGDTTQAGSQPDQAQPGQAQAAAVPAAGLETAAVLQALQAPLAAGTTLLASTPAETGAAVSALSGNAAAAQAVGAAALPGASGAVRVTATAAAEASRPTAQDSLLSQVDGSIRWLVKNQDKGAELQLHPESLGRIQISLKVEGTVVHAKVWASEASTVPVLQDHRATLETSLKGQGLTLGSFDLQHGRRDQETPLPASTEPSAPATTSLAQASTGQESPVLLPAAPARTSRIEYVA